MSSPMGSLSDRLGRRKHCVNVCCEYSCGDRTLERPERPTCPSPGLREPSPEVEDVGAGQGLQPAVPLADGLPAQAAVELGLLHALVEAHDVGAQLPLQPLAAVDALAQTVQLQLAQLGPRGRECRRRAETRSVPVSSRPPPLAQPKAAQGPVLGTFLPGGWTWGKKMPCPLWALVSPRAE